MIKNSHQGCCSGNISQHIKWHLWQTFIYHFSDLVKLLSHVQLFATPWTVAYQAPPSMEFSRQEYWSGLPFLLQGIFPTQGLNPGLPYCRQTLYHLSHQGSPFNILLKSKELKTFPLKSGRKHTCSLLPPLLNVLEVLATVIRHGKEIKGIQIGRKAVKLSFFADDLILYIENPKVSTKKLLELVNEFSKVSGYETSMCCFSKH